MAEAYFEQAIGMLNSMASNYEKDNFNVFSVKEKLEILRAKTIIIKAVLSSAKGADIIDRMSLLNQLIYQWIWRLRHVCYVVEDLFDDFEYLKLKELASDTVHDRNVMMKFFYNFILGFCESVRHTIVVYPILKKLEEVVQKFVQVSSDATICLDFIDNCKNDHRKKELYNDRETGFMTKKHLIGLDDKKQFIIEWCRKSSHEEHQTHVSTTHFYKNISLLSIVGHGGMGKTELVRHVYQENEIMNEFQIKMWVCVTPNFNVKRVIVDMVQCSMKVVNDLIPFSNKQPDLVALSVLQNILESNVRNKKFLLVLDDIWEKNQQQDIRKWKNVFAPLACGKLGSKIIITTRLSSVASLLSSVLRKKEETIRLDSLEEAKCLQLLNTCAFAKVRNPDDYIELRSITTMFVKNLYGYPLAATVIGCRLNYKLDERHWMNVFEENLCENDIFSTLHLSYTSLPLHIQNCFKFCSIFSQGHLFDKDDLIRMWIAVGFIHPSYIRGETLEKIGDIFFDVLVNNLFFDKVDNGRYKMHDLLYDFAQYVSTQECLRVVGAKLLSEIPKTITHLSVETCNLEVLKKIKNLEYLRTLHIKSKKNDEDLINTLSEIFKASRRIRLLHIEIESLQKVPEGIKFLTNMRYLKIDFAALSRIPGIISDLYHLSFILSNKIIPHGPSDVLFPRHVINLPKLHYSELPLSSDEC